MTSCVAFSMPCLWTMTATPQEAHASCANVSRRRVLRLAVIAATAAAVLPGTSTPVEALGVTSRQVINGVLSGYGLPILADVQGFSPLLEQYDRLVVELQHPSDWIIARNVLASTTDSNAIAESTAKLSFGSSLKPMEGRASGLTVGDYRKAEGLAFFVSSNIPSGSKTAELPASVIINLVTPGDATSGVPECKVIKDGFDSASGYRKLLTKYESTTASGYTVERRGVIAATVLPDGKLYCLSGTCSETRWKKIGDKLAASVDSFRVYSL